VHVEGGDGGADEVQSVDFDGERFFPGSPILGFYDSSTRQFLIFGLTLS
jgi:hypothetical protein